MRDAAQLIAAQQDGTHQSLFERAAGVVRLTFDHAVALHRRQRTLAKLEALDDYMLTDIGLSRTDLETEADRGSFGGHSDRFGMLVRRRREERWL